MKFDILCTECHYRGEIALLAPWRCKVDPSHKVLVVELKPEN